MQQARAPRGSSCLASPCPLRLCPMMPRRCVVFQLLATGAIAAAAEHAPEATAPSIWWCSWAAPGRTLLLG